MLVRVFTKERKKKRSTQTSSWQPLHIYKFICSNLYMNISTYCNITKVKTQIIVRDDRFIHLSSFQLLIVLLSLYLWFLSWMISRLVTQLIFVDDCYFPCKPATITLYVLLGITWAPYSYWHEALWISEGVCPMKASGREKRSALTWKLWVYERGSYLTCKTNHSCPFVKSWRGNFIAP